MMDYRFILTIGLSSSVLLGCQGCDPPVTPAEPKPAPSAARPAVTRPAVTVTPRAAAEVRRLTAGLPADETMYLRVRVTPGGCQGFQHKLDLDSNVALGDVTWESASVRVVASRKQVEMLRGSEVDFGEKDGDQGFLVENPNFKGDRAAKWLAALKAEAGAE